MVIAASSPVQAERLRPDRDTDQELDHHDGDDPPAPTTARLPASADATTMTRRVPGSMAALAITAYAGRSTPLCGSPASPRRDDTAGAASRNPAGHRGAYRRRPLRR